MSQSITPSRQHFHWLDLLRFVAAFLVLACHFRGAFFQEWTELPAQYHNTSTFIFFYATRLGQEAVLFFFILSGFLVGGRTIQRAIDGTFSLPSFAIDRAVRIYLPLISALLILIPVAYICGTPLSYTDWFGSLFQLQNIYTTPAIEVLWSLNYEVYFYIFIGATATLLISYKSGRYKRGGYAALILTVVFMVFTKLSAHYIFIWLMGAMAYLVMPRKRNRAVLYLSFLATIAMSVAIQCSGASKLEVGIAKYISQIHPKTVEILFALASCLFIQQLTLSQPRLRLGKLIERSGTRLAAFSYTLYLVHIPILRLLEHFGAPKSAEISLSSIALYLLWLAIALLSSYIIYFFFEKRTSDCKRFLKRKLIKHQPLS